VIEGSYVLEDVITELNDPPGGLYKFYQPSNYKVYVHIVKHNYRLGGMLFTICKAQLHTL